MATKNPIDLISLVLVIIGGLNWGLVGLMNYDIIASIFGAGSAIARVIYVLVGLAALYMIYFAVKDTTRVSKGTPMH